MHGYKGLIPKYGYEVSSLTPDIVNYIHMLGGSILSLSQGNQDVCEMVDALERMNINLFFVIGGDGTMRGAELIMEEIRQRKLKISVIGISKTIDDDMALIQKVSDSIRPSPRRSKPSSVPMLRRRGPERNWSGKVDGPPVRTCSGLCRPMALADVNFVLIPEVSFDLEGEKGFLKILESRIKSRGHAVILVAEGAGQYFFQKKGKLDTDASGNLKLFDIGTFLKKKLKTTSKKDGNGNQHEIFRPSYLIRSVPANASDSLYCGALANYAVHAAMAGKTGMVVGLFNDVFVHLPLRAVASKRKTVDPEGEYSGCRFWNRRGSRS